MATSKCCTMVTDLTASGVTIEIVNSI